VLAKLLALTIPVTAVALLYARWEYRKRGKLSLLGYAAWRRLPTAISIVGLTILSACATGQLPVVEKLDDITAVTITYSRSPVIMGRDTAFDRADTRDYVQLGAIEVNRMGGLQYYLWLGISDIDYATSTDERPDGYESIVIVAGGEELQLDVLGWTPAAIGASEPVYKKLFTTSVDAYYEVSLDQIQSLATANVLKLRTGGSDAKEFIPWYGQAESTGVFVEFVRNVL